MNFSPKINRRIKKYHPKEGLDTASVIILALLGINHYQVKVHAERIALCAGLHHAMYEKGYGLTIKDFPEFLGLTTVKKILEVASIVAVCDDIDAALHRKTWIKNKAKKKPNLRQRLMIKFPDDKMVVDLALKESRKIANNETHEKC